MSGPWTPGPWLSPPDDPCFIYALDADGCNRFWARVSAGAGRMSREEVDANARLIAAAPALAEALERVRLYLAPSKPGLRDGDDLWFALVGGDPFDGDTLGDMIDHALALARGEVTP